MTAREITFSRKNSFQNWGHAVGKQWGAGSLPDDRCLESRPWYAWKRAMKDRQTSDDTQCEDTKQEATASELENTLIDMCHYVVHSTVGTKNGSSDTLRSES